MTNSQVISQLEEVVQIGSSVSIMLKKGEIMKVTIRTPEEVDLSNYVISDESPLGRALLEKKKGDKFQYIVEKRVFKGIVVRVGD